MMNPLARRWLERQVRRAEIAELRQLVRELDQQQAELRPMVEASKKARQAARRQDGPTGFVMVEKEPRR